MSVPPTRKSAGRSRLCQLRAWFPSTLALTLALATALPAAAALLRLAPQLLAAGAAVPAALAVPRYIRDKVAQTTEERAAQRAAGRSPA